MQRRATAACSRAQRRSKRARRGNNEPTSERKRDHVETCDADRGCPPGDCGERVGAAAGARARAGGRRGPGTRSRPRPGERLARSPRGPGRTRVLHVPRHRVEREERTEPAGALEHDAGEAVRGDDHRAEGGPHQGPDRDQHRGAETRRGGVDYRQAVRRRRGARGERNEKSLYRSVDDRCEQAAVEWIQPRRREQAAADGGSREAHGRPGAESETEMGVRNAGLFLRGRDAADYFRRRGVRRQRQQLHLRARREERVRVLVVRREEPDARIGRHRAGEGRAGRQVRRVYRRLHGAHDGRQRRDRRVALDDSGGQSSRREVHVCARRRSVGHEVVCARRIMGGADRRHFPLRMLQVPGQRRCRGREERKESLAVVFVQRASAPVEQDEFCRQGDVGTCRGRDLEHAND